LNQVTFNNLAEARRPAPSCDQVFSMNETRLTLLNTSLLTDYGTFIYQPLSLDEARKLVREFEQAGKTIQSAIGHQSTANLLTELLAFPVTSPRADFKQTVDDLALIFKLKQRPPEGKILSREELETVGYEFGLLKRTA
jgi:hypothetical protein